MSRKGKNKQKRTHDDASVEEEEEEEESRQKNVKKRLKQALKAVDEAKDVLHEARAELKEAKQEMKALRANRKAGVWTKRMENWETWYAEYAKNLPITKLPSAQAKLVVQFALSNHMECTSVEFMPYFFYEAKSKDDASAFQRRLDELVAVTPALYTEHSNSLWFFIYLSRDPGIVRDALTKIKASSTAGSTT